MCLLQRCVQKKVRIQLFFGFRCPLLLHHRIETRERRMGKEDEDEGRRRLKVAKEWIEDLSHGRTGHLIENRALRNLEIKRAEMGFFLCNYIVPHYLSDKDGNWSVGAIATVIDVVGAAAIASTEGEIKVSVDFNISYFSTAKIQEQVEIEARVVGHRGKLSSILVVIRRRKSNGEMIALGKQWMTSSTKLNTKLPLLLTQQSKL